MKWFAIALLLTVAPLAPVSTSAAEKPAETTPAAASASGEVQITPDVVYGHKDGMALTYDVLVPPKPNGAAIVWIQSGGWYSGWRSPENFKFAGKAYLDDGYALYIVRHGSSPKYHVVDAAGDVRRAIRHIRGDAKRFGVDPERIGVTGGSAGGHLSLMIATTGDDGDPKNADPVLRNSSRVAAAAVLYPPTDLRKWTTDPPAEIKKHAGLKPSLAFDSKLEPDVSPLLHVSDRTAPALLVHGDKDELVTLDHSEKFVAAMETAGVPHRLIIIEGAAHGFTPEQNAQTIAPAMKEWFAKYLKVEKD
ncbi:MAG: prolyl oligopeptidase family serine peptidase [Planctomycetales bacterium]|nr:prolyl oligopeptidase family serine peptidase [Planctomycetales bacterium]MBN8626308.1 prolyl oligopeptidase family serine peptidase [Planctomycetota bacterium]